MNKFDAVANIAHFLQEKKGSVLATWEGKLTAKEQRALFGAFLGKGLIRINGATENVKHIKMVGFGQDYEYTTDCTWVELANKVEQGEYK